MKRVIQAAIVLVWLLFISGPAVRFIQDYLEIGSLKPPNWNELKDQELKLKMREMRGVRPDLKMLHSACFRIQVAQDRAKCIKEADLKMKDSR